MNGPTFAQANSAAAPAAVTSRPPALHRAARPDPDAGNGLRILTYLRLHWLTIAFCGTLLGSAASYAAWDLLPSKFESYALLQVSSAPTSLANQNNPNQARTDFTTYVKTTAALIKSDFVLNAAFSLRGLTSGALLGGLFMAVFVKSLPPRAVVLGMLMSLVTMILVTTVWSNRVFWPWYTLIGTTVTLTATALAATVSGSRGSSRLGR